MTTAPCGWRRNVVVAGLAYAVSIALAGCNDPVMNSGMAHTAGQGSRDSQTAKQVLPDAGNLDAAASPLTDAPQGADTANPAGSIVPSAGAPGQEDDPARVRTFTAEGPDGALRVNFDDLDLLKLIKMDPVTPDCVEKMPEWLKDLGGKKIRIRGYMKPSTTVSGIPQFVFVRSTDLCCFGPKGKVYHLIAVTLKNGMTTDYISLTPFDVVGTFRIEIVQLDDGLIFLLYHIDDAAIIRK